MLKNEEVKDIAKLAKLDLSDKEIEQLGPELSSIIGFIEQLEEVNTDGVVPTAQVTGLSNVFREDDVKDWSEDEKEKALNQAPLEGNQIKVKRVLD